MYWFWGLLQGALGQANVSHCLCPAGGYLVGASLVRAYAGPREATCCDARLAATYTRLWATQQKAQGTQKPAAASLGPADLREYLRNFIVCAEAQPLKEPRAVHELLGVGSQGVTSMG